MGCISKTPLIKKAFTKTNDKFFNINELFNANLNPSINFLKKLFSIFLDNFLSLSGKKNKIKITGK